MVVLLLKFFQQRVERLAFGHEHGGADDVVQLELLRIQREFEQVFGVQNADNVVFVVGDDGKARMGGVHGIGDNAFDAVGGFEHVHLGAANHGIANVHLVEIQDVFQARQSILVDNALGVRLLQQGAQCVHVLQNIA